MSKEEVSIDRIESAEFYTVKLYFDNHHNTGISAWKAPYVFSANRGYYWHTELHY